MMWRSLTHIESKTISLLKDVKIWKRLEENVIELVDIGVLNSLGNFKDSILKACDEVCVNKCLYGSKEDTW